MTSSPRALALAFAALVAGIAPACAQSLADFYTGKKLQMVIGFGPGGGYDLWGRTVARHLGNHLPGKPSMVPENMPGAGSFTAANHIYTLAPKDGTVMGIIARDAPLGPLTGADGARFDALKFTWIGSPTEETNVCISYKTSKVKTFDDLLKTELVIGDTGAGTGTYTYPRVLNAMVGTKFKIIGGFPSSNDVFLAMERGEVEGICESLDSVNGKRPDWIKSGTVNLLFQGGSEPNPAIKDVPFIYNLAKTEEQKQAINFVYSGQGIGRPFVSPPGMPADRTKALRDAFEATMKNPAFIEDAKKQKLDVEPVSGDRILEILKSLYGTPKPVIDKVSKILEEAAKK
jgi:tripartite-type tricarboxylate transporter receptor subunit TctC